MFTGEPDARLAGEAHLSDPRITPSCFQQLPFSLEDIESTIWDRFLRIAELAPAALAVIADDGRLTFADLRSEAERLSTALLHWTTGLEEPVGVLLPSGCRLAVAILAIARSGRIFLGLDPAYPVAHLRTMLADSGASLVLCDDTTAPLAEEIVEYPQSVRRVDSVSDLPEAQIEAPARISPDTLVQLCYTSGSTGEPKGLVQNHRNRLLNALDLAQNPGLGFGDRMSALFTPGFNSCLGDYLGAALTGAALVPLDARRLGYRGILNRIRTHRVNVINWLSTGMRELVTVAPSAEVREVRAIQLFGEPLTAGDVQRMRQIFGEGCRVYNLFGTSETGLLCSFPVPHPLPEAMVQVPIGRALLGKDLLLLDADGAVVPQGEPGEIVARGRFVTPGYWKRPDLTRTRIHTLPDPAAGRQYRTGDFGRFDPDGCLVHLGRKDFQIKIRGSRIEAEEVEAHLHRLPGVLGATVAACPDPHGEACLVAYLVAEREGREYHAEIRRLLAQSVPAAMVPHRIIQLPELPRTPNGKLDRAALPPPDWPSAGCAEVSPQTALEPFVQAVWEELLGVDSIESSDDFFALGGDSILAARLANRLHSELGAPVHPLTLFTAPTFQGYCRLLREHHPAWKAAEADDAA